MARHIVPTALLVRVQRLRNGLYKAVKRPSTIPIGLVLAKVSLFYQMYVIGCQII